MIEQFTVELEPHTIRQTRRGLTVTKELNQKKVFIVTADSRTLWGYCHSEPAQARFLPLSGFPAELVAEVQRQINLQNGFDDKDGPQPPAILFTGRTAAEQRQDDQQEVEEFE